MYFIEDDFGTMWIYTCSSYSIEYQVKTFKFFHSLGCDIIQNHNITHKCGYVNRIGKMYMIIEEKDAPFVILCGLRLIKITIYDFEKIYHNILFTDD